MTTDAAVLHLYPFEHTPQWTRTGYAGGAYSEVLWGPWVCWCGLEKEEQQ